MIDCREIAPPFLRKISGGLHFFLESMKALALFPVSEASGVEYPKKKKKKKKTRP